MNQRERTWREAPRAGFDDNPRAANFQDAQIRKSYRGRLIAASIVVAAAAIWIATVSN